MEMISSIGLLLGSSWASGVNLYMSMAGLGIAHRMNWLELPGDLEVLSHPLIIGVAGVLYLIEFVADKIPYVDSLWDSVHTFIRPIASAVFGYAAMGDAGQVMQILVMLLTGGIALDSHLTKATTRLAINASPEPLSNSVASVTEDVTVVGILYLIINHPIIVAVLTILFIAFSIWFLKKMFKYVKKAFSFSGRRKLKEANT